MSDTDAQVRVAVIGAGWAGCAAAVELVKAGFGVTLLEAARTAGGRARSVAVGERLLDNGQHILLGAYRDCLRLMDTVGIQPDDALLRMPLAMRYAPHCDGMDFAAAALPAPLHLALALWRARGLGRDDKLALIRFRGLARWLGWRLDNDCTVDELLARYEQPARLVRLLWHPLCIAALNTPPAKASSNAFLAVLRDSLGAARRADSDMLLPRRPLGELFPEPALAWLRRHGAHVELGASVKALAQDGQRWRLEVAASPPAGQYDAVVVATSPTSAAQLLAPLPGAAPTSALISALEHEPIASCYLQYAPGTRLPHPIAALLDDPAQGRWGQFAFDRGALDPAHDGLLAVVVSAAGQALDLPQAKVATDIAAQLAHDFGQPALRTPVWSRVITDKRATFACMPGVVRPANATGLPGLLLAGDYTASDYPATLETAVRSGMSAASIIRAQFPLTRKKRSLSHPTGAAGQDSVR